MADALSRVNPHGKNLIKVLDVTILEIIPQPKMDVKVQEIQQATIKDQILQLLMEQHMES